jgi:hypothetical protein
VVAAASGVAAWQAAAAQHRRRLSEWMVKKQK